ncbi:hypothetical protein A2U01_0071319, partial [Trifolium medium]|nr:hypothetical protein [Trifolium medium]
MQIGVDVSTLDNPPPATACFLVTTYSLGPLNGNPHYLDPVPKRNTVALPMWSPNPAGYATFYLSYIVLFTRPPWSTATT